MEEKDVDKLLKSVNILSYAFIGVLLVPILFYFGPYFMPNNVVTEEVKTETVELEDEIINGIHVESGLIVDEGYLLVKGNCGACHSLKLVTQNRATREGWKEIIVWMQETQKLWDLGKNEPIILDYLGRNYKPTNKGRRPNLENVEWYDLK